ncbi:MAG: hypothetical protein R3237_05495 [Nitrosopumilaceae archaeon]|nr:hypothetical protein [Nitrosopumilaceae archaeon]
MTIPVIVLDVYGQTQSTLSNSDNKKNYEIGVYILNVGKIDLQTGTYDLDFYLWIRSDQSNFVENPPKIEFMNGKASMEPISIEENYYEYRVKGNFQKNMNFKNYPFEQLQLTIEVEGLADINKLEFVVDEVETGIDKLVNIPGWNLKENSAFIQEHEYSDGSSFSRFVFALDIERFPLSSFLKTIFPVLIITTIAMLAFWMSPTNFTARIGLGASTLLAAVAAHLNAAGQLPPIGYLTLMDKIMIIAYSLFLNNLLSMVIQMRLIDHNKPEEAQKINSKMRKLMPIIIVIIFLGLFFA